MLSKEDKTAIVDRAVPVFSLLTFLLSFFGIGYGLTLCCWMNGVATGHSVPLTLLALCLFCFGAWSWNPLAQYASVSSLWRIPFSAFEAYPLWAFALPATAIFSFLLSFIFCPAMSDNIYIVDGKVKDGKGFIANPLTSDITSVWIGDNGVTWEVDAMTSDQFPVTTTLFLAFKNGEKDALESAYAEFKKAKTTHFYRWMRSEAAERLIKPKIRGIIEKVTLRELFPGNWIVAETYRDITNKELSKFGLAWKNPPNILSIDPTLNEQN